MACGEVGGRDSQPHPFRLCLQLLNSNVMFGNVGYSVIIGLPPQHCSKAWFSSVQIDSKSCFFVGWSSPKNMVQIGWFLIHYWLLVYLPTSLKNISSSVGMMKFPTVSGKS